MKGQRYVAIQKASTGILKDIPNNDLKHSFEMFIDHAKRCIDAERNYFE